MRGLRCGNRKIGMCGCAAMGERRNWRASIRGVEANGVGLVTDTLSWAFGHPVQLVLLERQKLKVHPRVISRQCS